MYAGEAAEGKRPRIAPLDSRQEAGGEERQKEGQATSGSNQDEREQAVDNTRVNDSNDKEKGAIERYTNKEAKGHPSLHSKRGGDEDSENMPTRRQREEENDCGSEEGIKKRRAMSPIELVVDSHGIKEAVDISPADADGRPKVYDTIEKKNEVIRRLAKESPRIIFGRSTGMKDARFYGKIYAMQQKRKELFVHEVPESKQGKEVADEIRRNFGEGMLMVFVPTSGREPPNREASRQGKWLATNSDQIALEVANLAKKEDADERRY